MGQIRKILSITKEYDETFEPTTTYLVRYKNKEGKKEKLDIKGYDQASLAMLSDASNYFNEQKEKEAEAALEIDQSRLDKYNQEEGRDNIHMAVMGIISIFTGLAIGCPVTNTYMTPFSKLFDAIWGNILENCSFFEAILPNLFTLVSTGISLLLAAATYAGGIVSINFLIKSLYLKVSKAIIHKIKAHQYEKEENLTNYLIETIDKSKKVSKGNVFLEFSRASLLNRARLSIIESPRTEFEMDLLNLNLEKSKAKRIKRLQGKKGKLENQYEQEIPTIVKKAVANNWKTDTLYKRRLNRLTMRKAEALEAIDEAFKEIKVPAKKAVSASTKIDQLKALKVMRGNLFAKREKKVEYYISEYKKARRQEKVYELLKLKEKLSIYANLTAAKNRRRRIEELGTTIEELKNADVKIYSYKRKERV